MTARFVRVIRFVFVVIVTALAANSARAFDIGPILDTCPTHDPAYQQIRADFEIRHNSVLVGDIPCTEPISAMPIAQYTDELIVVQGLRAVLYMDLVLPTTLPWAPTMRLYDWLKSKNAGVNIDDVATFSSCCTTIAGKTFFTLKAQDAANRDFDREWRGISGNIDLYAHELRHLDNFPHVSCCGTTNGCDQSYDESNLSPYGIQWWLNKHWLDGSLYTGFSCLAPTAASDAAQWHLSALSLNRNRFCTNLPPVQSLPSNPGGTCRSPLAAIDLFILVDLSGSFIDDLPVFKTEAPAVIAHLAAQNPNLHVGIGAFQDYPISPFGVDALGDRAYYRVVDLTSDQTLIANTIAGLNSVPGAGGDEPQSQLTALYQAASGAGQDLSGAGFPSASIPVGQAASFRTGATKLILLWTDATFHQPGDPGSIGYPGPDFATTVAALFAVDPAKVIGVSSGGVGIADLQAIAAATGAIAPAGGVDCNADGVVDLAEGAPLVCEISSSGPGIGDAIGALAQRAVDAVAPIALCADRSLTLALGACSAEASIDDGSFDPDGVLTSLVQSPPGPYPDGDNAVTLTVTDTAGLTSSCVAQVSIAEITPPVIALGASTAAMCLAEGQDTAIAIPTAVDACAGAVTPTGEVISIHGHAISPPIALANGHAALPLGSIVVRWSAQDPSGNASAIEQAITVVNDPRPECSDPLLGGSGNDQLFGTQQDDFIYPGPGKDQVNAKNGDDTVLILDVCEAVSKEILDGGPGYDTLITPVPASVLTSLGVKLNGFENIVVDATKTYLSECF